ncbi:hypothetical protein GX51_00366 [Blastomyces parvus]|uniref:Uncharacterized protein n=1 Tax=Blastomyces parvus TaxID=2060905 RepID=A0A2B7XMA8_9EURO|nr:hypothetical protein GX51_00366 [Blastomyces parvus]
MQSFWSRTALSTGSCRCVSCLRSGSNAVAGQAGTAASRRRLYIGNSVTLLYSAIFATAMMFDADAKTKRRTELEKKIEAVKEEVEELRIEELRILNGLAARRKVRQLPLPLQRRQYSTVAATATTSSVSIARYQGVHSFPMERSEPQEPPAFKERPETITDVFEKGSAQKRNPMDENERDETHYDLAGQDILRERAIQLLAMRQLAIKFLLRPSFAHSYGEVVADYGEEFDHPKFKTQDYLIELHALKRRITRLRFRRDESYDDLVKNITIQEHSALQQERQELHNNLQASFASYSRKIISLQRLLLIASENLLASEEPLLPQTVELMITQFTRSKQNDLVKMVIDSLFPNRIRMTPPVIVSAINFYNKTKDLFGFDGLLGLLQGDSFPVNIPVLWETISVGDVQVVVPPKPRHPFVMNALISASLSFNQPQTADAYLHILRETGYNEGAQVLGSYLRFYTMTPNWRKGRYVLLRSVAFIMSTKAHFGNTIERLILYMVTFCNSCGKNELSAAIVKAAVETGIDWRPSHNNRDVRSLVKTSLKQWSTAAEHASANIPASRSLGERCYEFAKQIEQTIRVTIDYSEQATSSNLQQSRERVNRSFDVRHAGQISESRDRDPTSDSIPCPANDELRPTKPKEAEDLPRSLPRKAEHSQRQNSQPDEGPAEIFLGKIEEECVKAPPSTEEGPTEIFPRKTEEECVKAAPSTKEGSAEIFPRKIEEEHVKAPPSTKEIRAMHFQDEGPAEKNIVRYVSWKPKEEHVNAPPSTEEIRSRHFQDEGPAEKNIVRYDSWKTEQERVKAPPSTEAIRRRRFQEDYRSLFHSLGVSKTTILDFQRELNEHELRVHVSELPAEESKPRLLPEEACCSLFHSLALSQKTIGDLQREVDEYGLHIHASEVPIEGGVELLKS